MTEFSRLARSTTDLLNIVQQLREKGVEFVSLKEQLDTNTPQGRFMLTVFAAMAELERETILQRQREGIAAAKRAGKLVHLRDKCFPVCCCIVELIPHPVTLCG